MLRDHLRRRRAEILGDWFRKILETYPPETQRFLRDQKNRFANPIGHKVSIGLETLFDALLDDAPDDRLAPLLDGIVRVRAVQDFAPSRALAFTLDLKGVIRSSLPKEPRDERFPAELAEIEARVDRLALLAFDAFMKCREEIYELRADEIRKRAHLLLERMNRIWDKSGRSLSLEEDETEEGSLEHAQE